MRAQSLLSLALLALATGCSDSTTGPDVPPPPTALASATIGPEGGSLTNEDVSIDIPAGAFTAAVELELFAYTDEFPAEGGAATGTYRISGLPAEFEQPLTVHLRAEGTPPNGAEPLLLLGEPVFVSSLQASGPAWHPVEAVLEDGFLSATLPANPGQDQASKDLEYLDLPLGGTFYYSSVTSAQGHFKIYHPLGMSAPAGDLGQYLEAAHTVFQGMGFSYARRTRWPVRAIVLAMPAGRSGECAPSIWGDNYGSLRFSTSQLPQADVMRVTAGHEFLHLVQAFYDPRGNYARATEPSRHLWLDEATAVWSEELFSSDLGHVSGSRAGLIMEPFEGLQAGVGDNAGWHGYGMSALIKYIVNQHGDPVVKTLYDNIRTGQSPVDAVKSVMGDFSPWLAWFFQEYVSGSLYGSAEVPYMIAENHGDFRVAAASDTLETFTTHDPALSACLFRMTLEYDQITPETYAEISLEGDGPAMLNVFKYRTSDGATLLGTGAERVTVEDLMGLKDDGYWVVILLTSMHDDAPHYLATQEHTTTIHLKQAAEILEVLQRSERVSYSASLIGGQHDFRYTDGDTTYVIENQNNFPSMGGTHIPGDIYSGPWPALSFSGRQFTSSMTYGIWEWTLSGMFSADGTTLLYVDAYGESSLSSEDVTVFSFRLNNLPLAYDVHDEDSAQLRWFTEGTGSMSNIFYLNTFTTTLDDGTLGEATVEYIGSDWIAPRAQFAFGQSDP